MGFRCHTSADQLSPKIVADETGTKDIISGQHSARSVWRYAGHRSETTISGSNDQKDKLHLSRALSFTKGVKGAVRSLDDVPGYPRKHREAYFERDWKVLSFRRK
jgi:hypothetical protein